MATRPSKITRMQIIKAAARIFAEHGYEGASIRSIVANADVNQAAINYHFGSKEGLYRAVLSGALQSLLEADEILPCTAGAAAGSCLARVHSPAIAANVGSR